MSPSAMYQALRAWWHGMRERKASSKKEAPKPSVRAKAPPPPPKPVPPPPVEEPPVARVYERAPVTPTPPLDSLKNLKAKMDELAKREIERAEAADRRRRLREQKNAPIRAMIEKMAADAPRLKAEREAAAKLIADAQAKRDEMLRVVYEWVVKQGAPK